MRPQQQAESIGVREVPLDIAVENLRFTKAIVEVDPPGCLAVVHYSLDGVAIEDGIAMDLDKSIFLDACEVNVSEAAGQVRTRILAGMRSR